MSRSGTDSAGGPTSTVVEAASETTTSDAATSDVGTVEPTTDVTSEAATPSPTSTALSAEDKYLAAVEKDGSTGDVQQGHSACAAYAGYSGEELIRYMINESPMGDEAAVKYLCPQYAYEFVAAQRGFSDGNYQVGDRGSNYLIAQPGTYRTAKGTSDCYWERSTPGGETIANDFVTNAAAGITVTIRKSDGGFSSERCGTWMRVN